MTSPVHHRFDGPPKGSALVLSNSLATTLSLWDPQVPALSRRFRVIRYDLRGHGRSSTPPGPYEIGDLGADLVSLLDDLEIPQAHLCGLSLGGMVAMWVAANAPERVGRLVLCSTSAKIGTPESWAQRAASVRTGGMTSITDTVLGIWFTSSYRSRDPRSFERMQTMLLSTDPEVYATCCDLLGRTDLGPQLPSIHAPTLVIAGSDDPSTSPAAARAVAEGIPDSRVAEVQGAAHLTNLERPEEVSRAILTHLLAKTEEEP